MKEMKIKSLEDKLIEAEKNGAIALEQTKVSQKHIEIMAIELIKLEEQIKEIKERFFDEMKSKEKKIEEFKLREASITMRNNQEFIRGNVILKENLRKLSEENRELCKRNSNSEKELCMKENIFWDQNLKIEALKGHIKCLEGSAQKSTQREDDIIKNVPISGNHWIGRMLS